MNIDTNITHITKSGSNIFLELGFDEEEAVLFNTQSQKSINDAQVLKEQLMSELAQWIVDNGFKQVQAAEILNTTRPRVSDLVNKKANKFTFDALITMLGRAGKKIECLAVVQFQVQLPINTHLS
jgi:predicted XRE-type DNA-binding protein